MNDKTMRAKETYIDEFGVTYTEDCKTLIKGNSELGEYTVPQGTEVIGHDAWGKMDKLKNINLPEGLLEIGQLAFSGCMGLTAIQLPSTLKEIGSYAFEFTMLRNLIIPEGVTVLRNDVFGECFGLNTVVLPSTLESIESFAFCSCPSPQLLLMAAERSLKYIDNDAFDGSNAIVFVPFNLQKGYAEAFPIHSMRFFGMKIIDGAGRAEVYSPDGQIVGEIPIKED